MTSTKEKDLRPAYVRCRDLDGQLWTVPRGSLLHQLLWSDVEQGYPEPYVPVELLREPWRGLTPPVPAGLDDPEYSLASGVQQFVSLLDHRPLGGRQQWAERIYRYGQYHRLCHRVKVRTSTNA